MYRWMIYNLQSTYTKHTSTNTFYSSIVHFPPTISFQERGLRLAMFESLEKGMRKARRGVKRKESTCTTGRNTEFCGCKVMWWNDWLICWIMLDSSEVASLLPNGCRIPDESWDSFYICWFAGFFQERDWRTIVSNERMNCMQWWETILALGKVRWISGMKMTDD